MMGCLVRAAWLPLALLTLAMPARAVDGTFKVTEKWSVTLTYSGFGPRTIAGSNGSAANRPARSWSRTAITGSTMPPAYHWSEGDLDLMGRQISGGSGGYSISGGLVFGPAYGQKAYGLVFLGAFVVKVPLVDGEVPVFTGMTSMPARAAASRPSVGWGHDWGEAASQRLLDRDANDCGRLDRPHSNHRQPPGEWHGVTQPGRRLLTVARPTRLPRNPGKTICF